MPFDESKGSKIAYDYSPSRADGTVTGAHFVPGKNGNAISFSGNDTCDVDKTILSTLDGELSILAWVQGNEIECGSPKEVVWVLNFDGLDNKIEVPLVCNPGVWYSVAMTKKDGLYRFYLNTNKIKEIYKTDVLKGISLNQDYYGGNYGFGKLDDAKIFREALTPSDIINEFSTNYKQRYILDGVDLCDYGVYISASDGLLSKPKLKTPKTINWDDYHGETVDLLHKFYEPRDITLHCFIKASSKESFIERVIEFEQIFSKKGTHRLVVDVHPVKPLIYEVYNKDIIEVVKEWTNDEMVGTFKLKLREPEPVKRVLKHIRSNNDTRNCNITITSDKLVNIFWGDGSVDYDISGVKRVLNHDYLNNGDYYPVITGCIEDIEEFETNAIIVWDKI